MIHVGKINFLKSGLAAGLIVLALLAASNAFDAEGEEPAGRADGGAVPSRWHQASATRHAGVLDLGRQDR